MNKKTIVYAIVLVSVMIGAFFAIRGDDITNYPPMDGPIIAFGDSLIYGVGSTRGNDFVSLLSRMIGEPIMNLGVPGDTTEIAFERLGEALDRKPRITLILLGGNDYLRKVPIDETFYNLREIVSALQDAGSITVILGVRGGLLNDRFDSHFEKLAEESGSIYVPDVLSGLITDRRMMSDAIHPNDAGYAEIAKKVYEKIETVVR